MNCPTCGFENPKGARFCGRCGEALGIECPSCGTAVPPGFAYCTACGTPLAETEERKVVTVLFADLVDFTRRAGDLDPEEVRRLLAPYYGRLRAELERHGGTVEKFIGDAVVALFGAPTAHEDDPGRGVRAALAIREAISELNSADPGLDLHVRVAVTTGEAVVSLGARPTEGEGMAAGDVLNTASRLQGAAPVDGILVDAATYRATADAVEYREAEPAQVKGKAEPIAVWEAVAAQRQLAPELLQRRRGRFVGRREEFDALRGSLNRARELRSAQLVTLVGEPGIGKSRLVYEFMVAAADDPEPAAWQLGRSLPYGEGVTYWALGEMVKGQAGILETDAEAEAGAKLHAAVEALVPDPAEARWVESHLRSLVGLTTVAEAGLDRRSEAFAAWRRFLECLAARRALVLAFEDLHWANDGLLDFVDHLAEWASGAPILLLGTARPELLERRPGWSETRENARTLRLTALADEETSALVRSLLDEGVLPPQAEAALLARAGGNPLFAGEYARMLVDRGLVGSDSRAAADDLPLPDSVQAVIAARLDALPGGEKALLQDAAVIGKAFWAGALAALGEVPRWRVEERLLALERKGFVRRGRRSSVVRETQYAFWHSLIRDVAYAQIPRGRRAEKHRLAADWIESLNVERAEDRAEMLAHHYRSALEYARAAGQVTPALTERARTALTEAGDRAMGLNAFAAAGRFYGDALDLSPPGHDERAKLQLRYGEAQFHAGEDPGETLAEAREGLLAAGDMENAAEATVILGELLWLQGDTDAAFRQFREAVVLLSDAPPSRSRAHVRSSLARFHMVAGRYEEAIAEGVEALAMAEELGASELRAHALDTIGSSRVAGGDPAGLSDLEESIRITAELNSLEVVRGYVNLGTALSWLGELEPAFEVYERGRRAAEAFGDPDRISWFEAEKLYEGYWRGRWDEALGHAEELIAETESVSPHALQDCRLVRGAIRLARDEKPGALEDSAWALEFARDVGGEQTLLPALAFRAWVLVAVGQAEDAGAVAGELLDLWAGDASVGASHWTADLARVLRQLGRGEEFVRAARSAGARTRWLEAGEAFASGEFALAAALYARIGSRPDEAFARLSAGARGADDEELASALAFYREVGATALIWAAEAGAVP